jgi:hemolysin activation/secretion protein
MYLGLTNDQIALQEFRSLMAATNPDHCVHAVDLGILADKIHRRLQSLGYVTPDFSVAQNLAKRALDYATA